MRYEVWGLHPANLIEAFETEAEALDEVRGLLDAGWSAEDLSLGQVEGSSGTVIAEGDDLAVLARSTGSERRPLSA